MTVFMLVAESGYTMIWTLEVKEMRAGLDLSVQTSDSDYRGLIILHLAQNRKEADRALEVARGLEEDIITHLNSGTASQIGEAVKKIQEGLLATA